jgi:hypothetical protein
MEKRRDDLIYRKERGASSILRASLEATEPEKIERTKIPFLFNFE